MEREVNTDGNAEALSPVSADGFSPDRSVPWGHPPTPLLPRWLRETLASVPLPSQLRNEERSIATVGDLSQYWDAESEPVDTAALRALVDLVGGHCPPPDYVVVPRGMDRSVLQHLALRSRTMNGLRKAGLLKGYDGVTVGQLLSIPYFGVTSLLDLMCVAEGMLGDSDCPNRDRGAERLGCEGSDWNAVTRYLGVLFAAASEFFEARTVGDALRSNLGQLASIIGLSADLDAIPIGDLTGSRRMSTELLDALRTFQEALSPTEQLILDQRILTADPQTLDELGRQVGVSRERVRQLQQRLSKTIHSVIGPWLEVIVALLRQQLGPVVAEEELDRRVDVLIGGSSDPVAELAVRLVRSHLGYSCANGICLDGDASKVVAHLRKAAATVADDVGLIDEEALRTQLPGERWYEHWDELLRCSGLYRIGGELALRDTTKARVKAALIEIGRPATREEVAARCGLDPGRLGSYLSLIPGVVRADKTRWGLAEWIDDEYQGIPAEVVQRINEDGGATPLQRLLDELPTKFGVSEASVRTYVGTPQFVLRDGYVSLADESSVALRNLDDVISGRDASGSPYWTFVVEERYFQGYSLVGFPPECARELGCGPNDSIRVQVLYPPDCAELSVIWRLSSATGASVGYLSEPLDKLGARSGDRIRLVLRGDRKAELRLEPSTRTPPGGNAGSAEALLERMKNRRRVL